METLPIDMSHPSVKNYLKLVRLQVLTPLSLLINIATVVVCATVIKPSIGDVSRLHPTPLTPKPALIAIYVMVIFIGQIGYCFLLVAARKPETKNTLIKGVGLALVFANWVMAFWAISWVLEWFLVATILQGLLLVLLIYSNLALLIYHVPSSSRPFDTALIHAPMRFFMILPLYLFFPISLFVHLGLTYEPTPGPPKHYDKYQWQGFGVVFGTNLLGLFVIMIRRDIVWCVAATFICVSLWSERPKAASIYITAILFTVLHPLSLIVSFIYSRFIKREGRTGRIALPPDDPNSPENRISGNHHNANHTAGPREVDEEGWGS